MFNRYLPLIEVIKETKSQTDALRKDDYIELIREIAYDMRFNGLAIELGNIDEEKFTYVYNTRTCKVRSQINDYQKKSMSEIMKEIKMKKQLIEKPNLLIMKKPDELTKPQFIIN